MKSLLILLLAALPILNPTKPITRECKCEGKFLYGKVKIVDFNEDFKVRVSEHPDLLVKISENPTKCGEWDTTIITEDFRVKFVEFGEDFTIKFSDFPGFSNSLINQFDRNY